MVLSCFKLLQLTQQKLNFFFYRRFIRRIDEADAHRLAVTTTSPIKTRLRPRSADLLLQQASDVVTGLACLERARQ